MFTIELHDLIVTKLGRLHAKDWTDIEHLTRNAEFDPDILNDRFDNARDQHQFYWPEKVEMLDQNFNRVVTEMLGLSAKSF